MLLQSAITAGTVESSRRARRESAVSKVAKSSQPAASAWCSASAKSQPCRIFLTAATTATCSPTTAFSSIASFSQRVRNYFG